MKEFALYKGEHLLAIGTKQEIAKKMKVKVDTISFYGSPANKRRIKKRKGNNSRILVSLDD